MLRLKKTMMAQTEPDQRSQETVQLQNQVTQLEAGDRVIRRLGAILDMPVLMREIVATVLDWTAYEQAVLLFTDPMEMVLKFGAAQHASTGTEPGEDLANLTLSAYRSAGNMLIERWWNGEAVWLQRDDPATEPTGNAILAAAKIDALYGLPLIVSEQLVGVLLVAGWGSDQPDRLASDEAFLASCAANLAVIIENARVHSDTVRQLAERVHELNMLSQIDRELNYTIAHQTVFYVLLDWVLRFTLAQASALALYDEDTDQLRFVTEYGYNKPVEDVTRVHAGGSGIAYRVARSGRAEVIPDTSMDKDYITLLPNMKSQLTVPVLREDRVIALIMVESNKINGFTDSHLTFVKNLAQRAGVAIDNARLYETTEIERDKLAKILNGIVDAVIVVNADRRLELINPSALAALRLYPNESYVGKNFHDVFEGSPLVAAFRNLRDKGDEEGAVVELPLANERTYHAHLSTHKGIGTIILLHDITPLKETDRLKNELIATVSHDLKQPLSVMNGYTELLMMQQALDDRSQNFVNMIQRSITNMRQLIDDLLDLAKIESGIRLEVHSVSLDRVLIECVNTIRPMADRKAMTISAEIPSEMPPIRGDRSRLLQIFNNLVGNAVKYTQPEGQVIIRVEQYNSSVRVAVEDNGLGISPEDQAHIFERFYRVRRPETDSIEGTGLGLAIVKKLVEAHSGYINLKSKLGEGTTFFVTLPVYDEQAET